MGIRSRVVRAVVVQFRRPTGALGRLAGWEMAVRSSNRRRNRWAVSLLDVRPTDRVLEIGFGPGIAIREIAERATSGFVAGIDHSPVMVAQARSRNAGAVRAGRVDLRQGSVESLPDFDTKFDKLLAVNSMGFWPDPPLRLKELRSVLVPGGVIAIVRQPRAGNAGMTAQENAEELMDVLLPAGFVRLRAEVLELKPPVVCVLGANPGP
ncbi:MAG TPA: class I SAM-dependent methyltransferase [Actinomycetota bacterium]|jgi:ubiquinone/menaquinone biosynthesis C-methylase UbiE|nr:class I SAM-dependent methyltransferase [Actinomycetota bacterium]